MPDSLKGGNSPADVIGNAVQVMRVATGGKVSETFAPPHAALPTTAGRRRDQVHRVARAAVSAAVREPDGGIESAGPC